METGHTWLGLAALAFVGSHFAMSHPLRPVLMRLGEKGFMLVYNLVSLGTLIWMAQAFRRAPAADLPGTGDIGWIAATILTIPALALFIGSITPRNPSLPTPMAVEGARAGPAGVFRVTRHPMLWGFALWAIAHAVLWWSWRSVIVSVAILALSIAGAKLLDGKKERQMGEAWKAFEAQTAFIPRIGQFANVGWVVWAGAAITWLAISWVHLPLGGVPAGIFRYL